MPSKPWPRWAGALTGCIFLVLFVCLPPLRKAGYQPEMLHYLLVPGAIAIVMTMIGTLLTALVVAREWERGTMEAIMATPVTMAAT